MIEIALLAFLFLSNAYWAFVCFKLTNRIMSRSYHEYVSATKAPVKREAPKEEVEERDEFAENQASQLNAILGVG